MLRRQQMHQLDQNAYGHESEHLIISRWPARESQVDRLSAEFVESIRDESVRTRLSGATIAFAADVMTTTTKSSILDRRLWSQTGTAPCGRYPGLPGCWYIRLVVNQCNSPVRTVTLGT
ncbi:hypothetical protein ACIBG0_25105 [Nocardia sp. NPDC050630]|uniref:hypothetical protein n=1 Tax=Nocardia sp. NPDC050630 TaxID=3364321 RepID=UPI00379E85F9